MTALLLQMFVIEAESNMPKVFNGTHQQLMYELTAQQVGVMLPVMLPMVYNFYTQCYPVLNEAAKPCK